MGSLSRREALLLALVVTLTCGFPIYGAAAAARYDVRILTGNDNDPTRRIVDAIKLRFPNARIGSGPEMFAGPVAGSVYVTIGAEATQAFIASGLTVPALALFVSSDTFARLVAPLQADRRRELLTALYAEASPQHQMQLVRALYQRRITVGVLLSSRTVHLQATLERAAQVNELDLEIRVVSPGENLLRTFANMHETKVLLVLPDRDLYTPETFRHVLESAYRRSQGVLGFSEELVRAGALAAAVSTIDDILTQAQQVVEVLSRGQGVAPQYPDYWRVQINEQVAQSLDLVLSDSIRGMGNIPLPSP